MHDIINITLKALGEEQKIRLVIYPGRYRGARELLRILEKEKNQEKQIMTKIYCIKRKIGF
jgi:hypothetical protein